MAMCAGRSLANTHHHLSFSVLLNHHSLTSLHFSFCPLFPNQMRTRPSSLFSSTTISCQISNAANGKDVFSERVGFLGIGIMGSPMAQNLIKAGCDVTVWNRTKSKCDHLISLGAKYRSSPKEVASSCDVTFAMLSDPESAMEVAFGKDGAATDLGPGKGYVDVSTVDGATSQLIGRHIKATGASFLEAPVSGSKKPAEDGQLIFLTAGLKMNNKKGKKLSWTIEMDNCLLEVLANQVRLGNKDNNTFNKSAYKIASKEINKNFDVKCAMQHIQNHMRTVKKKYAILKEIMKAPGFGWNDELKMVVSESAIWSAYIQEHPEANVWQGKVVENFYDMMIVCERDIPKGG